MKKGLTILILSLVFVSINHSVKAQSFHKGSFLISVSEGSTTANYTTRDLSKSGLPSFYKSEVDGCRDPLIIEFGLTKKWGIGLSSGADIFQINPSRYYGFKLPGSPLVEVATSELTLDLNYHYLVNKKWDLSAFSSVGLFSVAFKGNVSDFNYNHKSQGGILRVGTKARYYFYKRLGVMGILSAYSGSASPKGNNENTVGTNAVTTITGRALEFGLCFRFF